MLGSLANRFFLSQTLVVDRGWIDPRACCLCISVQDQQAPIAQDRTVQYVVQEGPIVGIYSGLLVVPWKKYGIMSLLCIVMFFHLGLVLEEAIPTTYLPDSVQRCFAGKASYTELGMGMNRGKGRCCAACGSFLC